MNKTNKEQTEQTTDKENKTLEILDLIKHSLIYKGCTIEANKVNELMTFIITDKA